MKNIVNRKLKNKNNQDYLLRYHENSEKEVIEVIYNNFGISVGYAEVVRYKK
ncbi:hypothetical protein [Oceanirhabdus sp. W0125-5]|uniref:hypothetical protein n=1 Tax=Oceanirhabdus sp. W0125-5 TaxID=2999116 RepID=UPI0022F33E3B|nr:hypothetical protein [Oceanirhabdus sp. W0125-5]WBW96901.1 hypothetical protein OW730_24905 [Oceanirhabdus sp. W0125-5]